ncbi:replication initiation protein [Helicobacter cetorum]|nr:replication initiation protein [Helicobacter cetorum]
MAKSIPNSKPKKSYKKPKVQKNLIAQDNRLIYSQYDEMTTNELKVFLWSVSKLNPLQDTHFIPCKAPISEILGALDHENLDANYTYIRKLCDSLSKRAFTDDTISIDPTTNKQVKSFRSMPIFQVLEYTEGQAEITYQLNDYMRPYLLGLKERFTQTPLDCILPMKSYYAIRIYQMLLSEIKQNKNTLKINVAYLQSILSVPKSLLVWDNFNRKVLKQAQKEINKYSNIVLVEVENHKQGRKIVDITFHFEYKTTDKKLLQEQSKELHYIEKIIKGLNAFVGKNIACQQNADKSWTCGVYDGDYKILKFDSLSQEVKDIVTENGKKPYKHPYIVRIGLYSNAPRKLVANFCVRDYKTLEKLKERQEIAESEFYTDLERTKTALEFKNALKQGNLLDLLEKRKKSQN